MPIFTDPTDKKSANRERREEKIKALMDALLAPEKNLQVTSPANILSLEKLGGFIVAFTMEGIEGDYDRISVKKGHAHYEDEADRMWLFAAERNCTQEILNCTKGCAIPVILLSPEYAVECTVIDTDTLQPDIKELVEANLVICQNALAD